MLFKENKSTFRLCKCLPFSVKRLVTPYLSWLGVIIYLKLAFYSTGLPQTKRPRENACVFITMPGEQFTDDYN